MDCPYCSSGNINVIGINPFSRAKKYFCYNCLKEFLGLDNEKRDTSAFCYGIPANKLQKCPGCLEYSCYYIGVNTVECANKLCKFYHEFTEENRVRFDSDKPYKENKDEQDIKEKPEDADDDDTKEITLDDIIF